MTSPWRSRAIGLGIAVVIAAIDQWVKAMVIGPWEVRERGSIELLPIFNLTWTQNFGVSLGMFTANSVEMRWILVAVTALIAAVVLVWLLRERKLGDIAPLALILGGAIGNIYDRFTLGYVVDYADLHFGNWRPFLVFNIADAAISIGVVIILARALFMREKPAAGQSDGATDPRADQSAEIS